MKRQSRSTRRGGYAPVALTADHAAAHRVNEGLDYFGIPAEGRAYHGGSCRVAQTEQCDCTRDGIVYHPVFLNG